MKHHAMTLSALALIVTGCGEYTGSDADEIDETGQSVLGPIPSGWAATKIGSVGGAVSAQYDTGDNYPWSIVTGGTGFNEATGTTGGDNFYFINRNVPGNGEVTVRSGSWGGGEIDMRAEIRNQLNSTASHVALGMRTVGGGFFTDDTVYRTISGRGVTLRNETFVGNYYKLVRRGSVITGYRSSDGWTWQRANPDVRVVVTDFGLGAYYGFASSTRSPSVNTHLSVAASAGLLPFNLSFPTAIGGATPSGTTSIDYDTNGGTFAVSGGGAGIKGTSDSFQFTYRSLVGDGTVVARLSPANGSAGIVNGGIMLRRSLAANASNVFISMNNVDELWCSTRTTSGANTSPTRFTAGAYAGWVKVVRTGNVVATYSSIDGQDWTPFKTVTLTDLGTTALVGFAVTSNANGQTAAVTADTFKFQPRTPQ